MGKNITGEASVAPTLPRINYIRHCVLFPQQVVYTPSYYSYILVIVHTLHAYKK